MGDTISVRRGDRFEHLDMLRGLAALLVLGGHLRAFVFVNYASLSDTSIVTKLFYGVTGLGHQAVIVFFALSGFLVGGPVLDAMGRANWSWLRYLLRRLTRLWIVVVPALIATLVCDSLGLFITGGAGYDGTFYDIYVSGPPPEGGIDLALRTFIANVAFVQTIVAPVFGTNSPIWSLVNEFWYYLLFPLFIGIFALRMHALLRIASIVLLLSLLAWLPSATLFAGLVWLAGAMSWRLRANALFRDMFVRAALIIASAATLVLTKQSDADAWSEILFGIAVALTLPALTQIPSFGLHYRSGARAAAEVSYTLYLTHFPFLSLIVFALLAPERFRPGLTGIAVYLILLIAALAWAGLLWWCFERHTDALCRQSLALLTRKAAA